MSHNRKHLAVIVALAVASLASCLFIPEGGHDHDEQDHHDREREHRHDLGERQKERYGALPTCRVTQSESPCRLVALPHPVVVPGATPLWG